jgi:hypothetical protein
MRRILTAACLGLLTLSLGCKLFNSDPGPGTGPAPRLAAAPKADDLVAYLNRNAQPITSIEAKDVLLTAKQNGTDPIDLTSYLACQKGARPGTPPNFRLQGTLFGNSEVDIGSNSEEFWFWIKRSAPDAPVYHCSYANYDAVAKRGAMPFPIKPEWVVEALGMAEYDPRAKYEMQESKQTYDLIQRTTSAKGDQLVKVIAFHKAPRAGTSAGTSQVAHHLLYEVDAKGKYQLVCSAVVEDSLAVAAGGGKTSVLPTKVRLNCPKEKVELVINLGKPQVNVPFNQQRTNDLFTRQLLRNYKSYDLARGPDASGSGVRQTGGLDR